VKRGGPLKRTAMKRSRRPLPPRSERGQTYADEIEDLRPLLVARAGGLCEAKFDGCWGAGTIVHHRLRRSQGGKNTLTDTMLVCDRCHKHGHAHPAQGYESGFLIKRGERPAFATGEPTLAPPPLAPDRSVLRPEDRW
jgi:5-methylcytosine-specific restriction endonuclease McrA